MHRSFLKDKAILAYGMMFVLSFCQHKSTAMREPLPTDLVPQVRFKDARLYFFFAKAIFNVNLVLDTPAQTLALRPRKPHHSLEMIKNARIELLKEVIQRCIIEENMALDFSGFKIRPGELLEATIQAYGSQIDAPTYLQLAREVFNSDLELQPINDPMTFPSCNPNYAPEAIIEARLELLQAIIERCVIEANMRVDFTHFSRMNPNLLLEAAMRTHRSRAEAGLPGIGLRFKNGCMERYSFDEFSFERN